ncbi:MAG TPA: hypothetical protein VIK95_03770 [Egibacteraceae bacterium]
MRDDPLAAWLRDADEGAADGDGVLGGVATAGAGDLFEPGDGAPPRDRSPRLLLLAVLPWAVVVVLAAALVVRVRVEASPSAAPPAPTPAPAVDTSPSPAAAEGAARAAAVLAVRAAVTDDDPEATARYVDLAVPEAVEQVGDVALVTVAAVVLEGDGARWQRARPARFAVPVAVTGATATPLAQPWPLPAAAPEVVPPAWAPAAAPTADSAAAALAAAGYRDVRDVRVSRSPEVSGAVLVEAAAVAPGEERPRTHAVWLRDGTPPTVLGAAASAGAAALPAADPTAAPAEAPSGAAPGVAPDAQPLEGSPGEVSPTGVQPTTGPAATAPPQRTEQP